jgi:hypothetical protein
MTKADVQKKLDLIQDKYNKIKTLVAQGKSLDEVKQALGDAESPASNGPRLPTFTETVYKELTTKS